MAEQFYTILTNIGKAKIANAGALGTKVDLKTLVLGDGNGSYYNPTETQTKLVREVYRRDINNVSVDSENPNWIVIETIVPSAEGGFTIREVGCLDTAGDLIVVGKYPETYKPKVEDGAVKDLTVKIIMEVSNAENVTIKVDPSVVLVSKKEFDTFKVEINTSLDDRLKINNGYGNKLFGDDLNNWRDIGIYASEGDKTKNIPVGDGWGTITITKARKDFSRIIQTYQPWNSGDVYYIRTLFETTWSPWKKILTQDDYDQLFQYVSDGKSKVASATTDMGVPTSMDATFDTIASNIRKIYTGRKFAKGTTSLSETKEAFELFNNSSEVKTCKTITVGNLNFKPSIIITSFVQNVDYKVGTVFSSNTDNLANAISIYTASNQTALQQETANLRLNSASYVNSTGFRIPASSYNSISGTVVEWIAYE